MKNSALVVEGVSGSVAGVTEVLSRFGFGDVTVVGNRSEAFTKLREVSFDIFVLSLQDIPPEQMSAIEMQVRKHPEMSIIAAAPATDPDLVLRAMRAGVREFLPHASTPEDLAGAVGRLVWKSFMNAAPDFKRGRLITVYSGKGGLGTTSVAVNLAQAMAGVDRNSRVAISDLVVTGGDVKVFLNLAKSSDISDLGSREGSSDPGLLNTLLTPCPEGLWALPISDDPGLEESLGAEAIRSTINLLGSHFPTTIADCEHQICERTVAALDASEHILVVTHLSVLALRSTQRTLAIFRQLGYSQDKICVVVNRHMAADALDASEAEKLLQYPIFWKLPNDYRRSDEAITAGVPLVLHAPDSPLARSYRGLARKLYGESEEEVVAAKSGKGLIGKLLSRAKAPSSPPPSPADLIK